MNPNLPPRLLAEFERKLISAEQAAHFIHSGDRVYIGSNCGQPQTLTEALMTRRHDLFGVEIVHLLTAGKADYVASEYTEHFRHRAFFMGANVRKAVQEGNADFVPVFLGEIPELFRTNQVPIDVAMVSVSPPDKHGYFSMGISVDVGLAACKSAKIVLAEINPNMPRTLGEGFLHISEIDGLVLGNNPIIEHVSSGQDETSDEIARHIAAMVEDGATLQTGIGNIPNAVLKLLGDKNDLGMHTEMFSDGVIPLIENGNLNCRLKTLHPNKVVTTFCMGSRALYDYIDNNPFFEFRPTEYVNDPFVVAQNAKMISINSAIEVDLTGQVCSDSIGNRFYSGIGGQVDFIRGAARSKGGKPIIAISSTAKNGDLSRIVPMLKPAAGVVTSRGDVHYVVTEYGVAYLHGKSIRERAISLIRIAHPKFRDELLEKAKELGYIPKDQPSIEHRYPAERIREVTLESGEEITFRPIQPTDEQLLRQHFYNLSEWSVRQRFNALVKALPNATIRDLVNVDFDKHMAVVGTVKEGNGEKILAVGRYYVNEKTGYAEFAMAVRDDWHRKGLGRATFNWLSEAAMEAKLLGFEAWINDDNLGMLRIVRTSGFEIEDKLTDRQHHVRLAFGKRQKPVTGPATTKEGAAV